MKKVYFVALVMLLVNLQFLQAQDDQKSKFSILGYGGVGFGTLKSDGEPDYNLNGNNAELLLNYELNDKNGIAIGIGLTELSGNGFSSLGNFFHERTLIKIPLLYTMNYRIGDDFRVLASFGFYGQTIVDDEYQFLTNTQTDVYDGWSFGGQFGFGFLFKVSERFSLGLNYTGQSDLTKFDSNSQLIDDRQRMRDLNSVGLMFLFDW